MTLFEYLSVAVSIVLGLAAARLLDALPHVLAKDRRYWVHATITCVCLANLGNSWWALWSLHAVSEWTSTWFFLVLGISGLHYTIAALLSSSAASNVGSWWEHYWEIRTRLYSLAIFWMALISLQNWILFDVSWRHPTRLVELGGIVLYVAGAVSANPRVHAVIAISMAMALAVIIFGIYASPAPLAPGAG